MTYVLSTNYLYIISSILDLVILLSASVISYQSYRICKYLNENKYKVFSLAFMSIALAHIFKILSNLTIFHRIVVQRSSSIIIILKESSQMQLFNFISFITYKSFLILGFILLFLIVLKVKGKSESFLFIYFSIIIIILSIYFSFLFHLTITIILFALVMHFYKNDKKIKSKNSSLVFKSFSWMFLGGIIGLFSNIFLTAHLIGEVALLIGFLMLLKNHLSINKRKNKNDKKKNKT